MKNYENYFSSMKIRNNNNSAFSRRKKKQVQEFSDETMYLNDKNYLKINKVNPKHKGKFPIIELPAEKL